MKTKVGTTDVMRVRCVSTKEFLEWSKEHKNTAIGRTKVDTADYDGQLEVYLDFDDIWECVHAAFLKPNERLVFHGKIGLCAVEVREVPNTRTSEIT